MVFGGMEESQLRWATKRVKENAVVWDIGAHHGYYAVALARAVALHGNVHAFEPFPESAEVIRRNAELNSLANVVHVHACAVGASTGRERLQLSENGPQNHSLSSALAFEGRTVEIPVITMDDQAAAIGSNRPPRLREDGHRRVRAERFVGGVGAARTAARDVPLRK